MPSTYDRRTFLTHSAATVGGVAMAGTVVDTLISDAASAAGLAPRVTRGGNINVGVSSAPPGIPSMNGWQGHWDAAGFYVGSAIFDPLFYIKPDLTGVLPGLALSAVASNSYKTWKITLRQGVTFHDGTPFNADAVVTNYAKRSTTVDLAIQYIIGTNQTILHSATNGITKVSAYVVQVNLFLSLFSFPYSLAEQQISFMAAPSQLNGVKPYPVGTGAFYLKNGSADWPSPSSNVNLTAYPHYWRKDNTGGALPYLSTLTFKTIVADSDRSSALFTHGLDLAVFYTGSVIKSNRTKFPVRVEDITGKREPSKNFVICNCKSTGPAGDVRIRKAIALSMNRLTYFNSIDAGVGSLADGIFRKVPLSPYYGTGPGYPLNGGSTTAKNAAIVLVNQWRAAHGNAVPTLTMQYVTGNTTSTQQFNFVQAAALTVGIHVNGDPQIQATVINNVIVKAYDIATWAQAGAIVPATNYVWWYSKKVGATWFPGFVNFANLYDVLIQNALVNAVKATSVTASKPYWHTVNSRFAIDFPYLWLDTVVTQWAASTKPKNWQQPLVPTPTSPKSTALSLSVANGSIPAFAQMHV